METPEVGKRYVLNGETVQVAEALKKRFWRIRVRTVYPDGAVELPARQVTQREWASATVAQP